MLRSFPAELHYAFRCLLKSPVFTIVAISTLALGIGANAAVFSFANATLLHRLPFPDPEGIVVLGELNVEKNPTRAIVSPRNLEDWQNQSQTLEDFGAWRDWSFRLPTANGTELIRSGIASPGFFKALALKPLLGRTFLLQEDQPGNNQVVIITYSFWQSYLGAIRASSENPSF